MTISERPRIKISMTATDKVLEVIAIVLLVGFWIFTLINYKQLPEIIPTHFDANGNVDDYGSKWTILLEPAIATVLFLGLSFLSRFPHLFNYAVEITPENAKKQYSIAVQMIRVLKLGLLLVFFAIYFKTMQAATGRGEGLGSCFLPISVGLIGVTIIYFLIKSYKNS